MTAESPISRVVSEMLPSLLPLYAFFTESSWALHREKSGIADLVTGGPQDEALPAIVETFARWTQPRSADWYGYRTTHPAAAEAVARALTERRGIEFEPDDIFLTPGAAGGLAIVLRAILDPGDEVVLLRPAWFFYEAMVRFAGGVPVWVDLSPERFDLDVDAVTRALGPRTRALILNSPHNPSGRAFTDERMRQLAAALESASARGKRRIYVVSDEAYARVLFDGRRHASPSEHHPATFVIYTLTKTLLTPGQRIGYVALTPRMPDREAVRAALFLAQIAGGHVFPSGPLQYAVGELERQSIDMRRLEARRDHVVSRLLAAGYVLEPPDGTFYVLCRSPDPDDARFARALAERRVFVLPGSLTGAPGYFRLSLTATDAMIDSALSTLEDAARCARL